MLVNKELLSEVLKIEVIEIEKISNDKIDFITSLPLGQSINIYKLSFLLKEWLKEQDFSYIVWCDDSFEKYKCYLKSNKYKYEGIFVGKTEIESVIYGCNNILKEIKK